MCRALPRPTFDLALGVRPTNERAHNGPRRTKTDNGVGGQTTRHALTQQIVKRTPVVAYDGVGHRVGVCRTSMEASPCSLLHRQCNKTEPAAEEEDGNGGPGGAHDD